MAGCLVRSIAFDRWMTSPGTFARAGRLDAGTEIVITGLGSSIKPCRSAAV
jgi:hypothetical protein